MFYPVRKMCCTMYVQFLTFYLEGIPVRQSVPLPGGSSSLPPPHPCPANITTTKLTTKTNSGGCIFTCMVGWFHRNVLLVLKIITSAGCTTALDVV